MHERRPLKAVSKTNELVLVYGGQYGSEGKGQIVSNLCQHGYGMRAGLRVGGPNAGHTFYTPSGKVVVQTLPVTMWYSGRGYIGPGGILLLDLLQKEMDELRRTGPMHSDQVLLKIDSNAAVITKAMQADESFLKSRIGSTGEGVGAATASKVMRDPATVLGSVPEDQLPECFHDGRVEIVHGLQHEINTCLDNGQTLLIEGTQGYGLSLHTGGHYPYCTSRECTPNGILADAGVNQYLVGKYRRIAVVRTFPIRVGGNSGPLPGEISWEQLQEETDGYVKAPEITTVTKKARRIARMDFDDLHRMVKQTAPTSLALTFFDYWYPEAAGAKHIEQLTTKHVDALRSLENILGVPIEYVSTGPGSTLHIDPEIRSQVF